MAAAVNNLGNKFAGYRWIKTINVHYNPAVSATHRLFCNNLVSRDLNYMTGSSRKIIKNVNTNNVLTSRARSQPAYLNNNGQQRNYCEDQSTSKKVVLHLMDFPEIAWPSILKSLRNWILANLVITPYFDKAFNLPDFVTGSKKAVEVVSRCLSSSDYDTLMGLVSPEALQEIKRNISLFSMQQRQELAICPDDIYFSFPYQVGVMFNDDEKNQKRFVEITMCYHVLQGLNDLKKQGVTPPLNMGMMPEYRDKIHICNYRFIREFTKGVEDEWTINVVNHFKPSDYIS